jgi:hypothetical protein
MKIRKSENKLVITFLPITSPDSLHTCLSQPCGSVVAAREMKHLGVNLSSIQLTRSWE